MRFLLLLDAAHDSQHGYHSHVHVVHSVLICHPWRALHNTTDVRILKLGFEPVFVRAEEQEV